MSENMMMFHSPAIVFPIRKKRTVDKYGKPLYAQVSTYGKQLLEKQYGNDAAQTHTYMELLGVTDEVLYDEPPPTIPTFDGISPKDRALATAPINRYVCGPFIHSGRHPAYEYGFDERNEEWRCCGLPYSSSGCWSSEKRVLYNFAPAIRIAKKPLNRENWLVPPQVGTKWYDFAYYDRLDAEMCKIKELITSFDWNDELTLRNLVRLYTLERYYNEVQEIGTNYPIDREGWIAFIQNDLMIQGPDLPLNPPEEFEEPERPISPLPSPASPERPPAGGGGNGPPEEEEELPAMEEIVSVFDEKMIDLIVRAESIIFTDAESLVSYIRNAQSLEELELAETRLIVLETNQKLWNGNANDRFRTYLSAHPTINGQDYLEFLETKPPLDTEYSLDWRNGLPWPDSVKKELESEILKLRDEIESAKPDSVTNRKFSVLIADITTIEYVETIRKMLHLYVENREQVNGTFLDATERRYIQNHMYVDNKPYLVISEKKKAVLADLASLGKQGAEFYKTIQNVKPSKYANNPAKFDIDIDAIIKAGFIAERDAEGIREIEYTDSTSWNKLRSLAFQKEMDRLKLEEEREQLALTQKRRTKELKKTLKQELIDTKQIITKQDYELFKDLISQMEYSDHAETEFSLALHFAFEKRKLLRILDMFPEKPLIADKYAQYESLWYYDDNNDSFDFERETMLLLDLFKTTLMSLISSHRKIPINMGDLEERMKNAPTFAALLDIYSHYMEALRNAPLTPPASPPPPRAVLKVRIDKDGVSDPALQQFYATYMGVIARLDWTYDGVFDMSAIEANLVKRLKEFILAELESDPTFVTSESFGIALNNANTVKAVLELEAEKRESMIRSNLASIETDADYRLSDYEYDWEKIHSQLIQPLSAMHASHPEAEKLGLSPYRRVEPLLLTLDDQTQYLHDLSRMEASIDYSQEQVRGISII